MLVVSDASPINILVRLQQVNILALLFQAVVIPASVAGELTRPATPKKVREWMTNPPGWLSIQNPLLPEMQISSRHRGERDAIRLAVELKAVAILLDEDKPRSQAADLGLRVVGTIGILEQAANKGHIHDLRHIHDQLRKTDFFIKPEILARSLARHVTFVELQRRQNKGGTFDDTQ